MNPAYSSNPDFQAHQDAEHLRLLSIFYYVVAGILAITGLIFIFHIIMGLAIVGGSFGSQTGTVAITPNTFPSAPPSFPGTSTPPGFGSPSNAMPSSFGWIFVAMGGFALLASETLAALTFYAGRSLARREKKTFIQVIAALLCLHVPLGTVLGVFTFIVLSRPTVGALFNPPTQS